MSSEAYCTAAPCSCIDLQPDGGPPLVDENAPRLAHVYVTGSDYCTVSTFVTWQCASIQRYER